MNICKIFDLGHKIGLHFDASHYKFNELSKNCRREVKVLESLFGFKNDIISFHRPVKQLLSNDKKLAGYDHTYMKNLHKILIIALTLKESGYTIHQKKS